MGDVVVQRGVWEVGGGGSNRKSFFLFSDVACVIMLVTYEYQSPWTLLGNKPLRRLR